MAYIRKEATIEVPVATAWEALRDYGALHEMAVGFVSDSRMDGDRDRIVTFVNGTVLRERLLAIDDDDRRVSWSIVDGPYSHHNGVAVVSDAGEDRTRFVWTADLLPDETAEATSEAMGFGLAAIKRTLEGGR